VTEKDDRDTIVEPSRTRLGVGVEAGERAKPGRELIGEILAGCLVEAELGRGAMGTVYRGTHVESGRAVAIKALHPKHVHEPKIVARFKREAKLAARLRHPHIAGVVDVGGAIDDGRHVIVLEFAEGVSLATLLADLDGPMPAARVVALLSQILLALEHAHDAGLIHRDLKPENIMVESRGDTDFARIVDFGIAILRDPDDSAEKLTATGQMVGTPTYMSPEQAMCEPFDHRTDQFAVGVIAYELLAGTLPFDGSAIDIAIANVKKDPPPIRERGGVEVDPLLEAFARKLMAKDRERRFASARAAHDTLALIASDREAAALQLGITNVAKALLAVTLPRQPRDS
jgi:eukaryotic-like serine/threonine-protein kinase